MIILLFSLILVFFLLLKQPVWFLEEAPIFNRPKPNRIKRFFNIFIERKSIFKANKLTNAEFELLLELKAMKLSSSEIAQRLGKKASTIRYWWNKTFENFNKIINRSSKLNAFHHIIDNILNNHRYTAVQIHRILVDKYNFDGSIDIVRRYVKKLKMKKTLASNKPFLVQRFEPGEMIQIDFVEFGEMYNPQGELTKIKVMIFVLGFSRHAYYHHVYTESMEEIFPAIARALDFFCGVPKYIRCDNFKAIVTMNENSNNIVYTREAKYFEKFFNVKFQACHVRSPWEKGIVENAAKYIQYSLIYDAPFANHEEAQAAIEKWNNEIAAVRIHGTTKEHPIETFKLVELPELKPLPTNKYEFKKFYARTVPTKCYMVTHKNNKYSVPHEYNGKEVYVYEEGDDLIITYGDDLETIAKHKRIDSKQKGKIVISDIHEKRLIGKRKFDKEFNLRANFEDLSTHAKDICNQLSVSERTIYMTKILELRNHYGNEIIQKVLEEAWKQQNFIFDNICSILDELIQDAYDEFKVKDVWNDSWNIEVSESSIDDYDV